MRWLRSDRAEYFPLDWDNVAYVQVNVGQAGEFTFADPAFADGDYVTGLNAGTNDEYLAAIRAGIKKEPERWMPLARYEPGSAPPRLELHTTIYVSRRHIVRMLEQTGDIPGMEVWVAVGGPPLGIAVGITAELLKTWARETWPPV